MAFDIIDNLAQSTEKILKECGKFEHVSENTSFKKLFNFLKRKYLYIYEDDVANDIMIDAWVSVFLDKSRVKIKDFLGYNPETGENVNIETYITVLMRNSIINNSIRNTRISNREKQSYENENESSEERQDRSRNAKTSKKIYRVDDEEIAILKQYIKDKEDILKTCNSRNKAKVERQIKRLKDELNEKLQIDIKTNKTPEWEDVYENRDYNEEYEDSVIFNRYINFISKRLSNKENLVLACLFSGISKRDISSFLNQKNINKEIDRIIHEIKEASEDMAFNDDDYSLYDSLIKYQRMYDNKELSMTNSLSNKREMFRNIRRAIQLFSKEHKCYKSILLIYFPDNEVMDFI